MVPIIGEVIDSVCDMRSGWDFVGFVKIPDGAIPQFLRYGIVGVVSNIVLYLLYLFLTGAGMGHKIAMTSLYILGVLQSFYFNKRWSFEHSGTAHLALFRYVMAYVLGYFLNLFALFLFVDVYAFPHQVVQGVMIVLLAFILFLMHRYWVFRQPSENTI